VCGLSCRLCPAYNAEKSWCGGGCKTKTRMAVGCPFITCALKKKGVEFCWDCGESTTCGKWKRHREYGKKRDSFKCYQTLESDIAFIMENGVAAFEKLQKEREKLLKAMLKEFNDGRSKSYYCIAATVMDIAELKRALADARMKSIGLDIKGKSGAMHSILDAIARKKGYNLTLRK
jgi:ACT domain-containing protein